MASLAVQPSVSETVLNYNLENVQNLVAQSTKNVTQNIIIALVAGHREQLGIRALAEKTINVGLAKELSEADQKVQMVFQKLYAASLDTINEFSADVVKRTLTTLDNLTNNPETSKQFLGTFVLPETRNLVNILKEREPLSLEDTRIWA